MLNAEEIAKRLFDYRGGRSRKEVANAVGISVSALQMYECAQRVPRDEIKVALARYYATTVGELFFEEEKHVS